MGVDEIFRKQHGVVGRAQAQDAGLTDRQIDYRIRSGAWVREHRGLYRLAAVAPSWESRLLGAVIAGGGVASHRCAAALWWLELYKTPRIEISVPYANRADLVGVRVHRSTQWEDRAETMRRGIPCTGIERTILDCGGVVSARTVERLAEAAIRREETSWTSLLSCLRTHSVQGRNGCLNLRRVLELRLQNRTIALSDFSLLVAQLLVDGGVPEPVLEYRIVDDCGDLILQTDLAWPSLQKAWELDGLRYHFGRTEVERDRRRRNRAKSHGWNIQEILWSMYVDDPQGLVEQAHKFLCTKPTLSVGNGSKFG